MSANNINLKDRSNYNLDILKNMTLNPQELSVQITPSEDIKQVKNINSINPEEKNEIPKYDTYNNSYISK